MLGFFLLGTITIGLNLFIKYILNKNGVEITYFNTYLVEYVKFYNFIRNTRENKGFYSIVFILSILFFFACIFYIWWMFHI